MNSKGRNILCDCWGTGHKQIKCYREKYIWSEIALPSSSLHNFTSFKKYHKLLNQAFSSKLNVLIYAHNCSHYYRCYGYMLTPETREVGRGGRYTSLCYSNILVSWIKVSNFLITNNASRIMQNDLLVFKFVAHQEISKQAF